MFRESASQIGRDAALWAARVDRGLSPDEEAELKAWQDADPRRLGAFGRVRAMAIHSERARALGSGRPPAAAMSRVIARRAVLAGGGAIAAGLAITALVDLRGTKHATGLGEVRVVALSDGSVVTLDALSEVEIGYDERRRTVRLSKGEALFDVAKDAARPFVVETTRTQIVAVGTSFSVSHSDSAPGRVVVREGVVEVRPRGSGGRPVQVSASQSAVTMTDRATVSVTTVDAAAVARVLSWTDGRLAFEGESLGAAAARFARYSETRLVIAPDIAQREIVGVFQANDPVGFARAAALAHGLNAEVRDGEVRISR